MTEAESTLLLTLERDLQKAEEALALNLQRDHHSDVIPRLLNLEDIRRSMRRLARSEDGGDSMLDWSEKREKS